MNNRITLTGKIGFEPEDKTKKHKNQASWKKMAMIFFDGDITEYYSWFIERRFNLVLNKPLRGGHISFINDSVIDLTLNGDRTLEESEKIWNEIKKKYHGKKIEVVLDLDPRSDNRTWWFNVPHDERDTIQAIRTELGLKKPYFGLHMTIGYANERNIEHSIYLHDSLKKGYIN